jgi:FAD:protein FMN transferase
MMPENNWQIILSCLIVALLPFELKAEWFKTQQGIMGTRIAVEIWHQDKVLAQQCSDKVYAEMRRIDFLMSPFKSKSELSKVNQLAAKQAVKITDELFDLIKFSLTVSEASAGAFDVTFASVGYLYDYRQKKKPSVVEISNKLKFINYRNIILNEKNNSIRFTHDGMRIDLGGIAKGYAVDQSIDVIKSCGIKNGLVSAGGDSRILGDKQGSPWIMGVRHPRKKNDVAVKLPLSNTAISTSGDYERFFIEDGKRIHHIIKPTTGKSVDATWSATVIADEATLTDALSTTLFVLGVKDGLNLINKYKGVDAIIIDSKGKMFYSDGLAKPN